MYKVLSSASLKKSNIHIPKKEKKLRYAFDKALYIYIIYILLIEYYAFIYVNPDCTQLIVVLFISYVTFVFFVYASYCRVVFFAYFMIYLVYSDKRLHLRNLFLTVS